LDLARSGHPVRLLDPNAKFVPAHYIGSRAGAVTRWSAKVKLAPEQSVDLLEIQEGKVIVGHAGKRETILCKCLVIAPGRVAYDPLSTALYKTGVAVEIVGDARKPRSYGNAIHEAAYLSRRI
jgi:hypothetical protein